VFSYSVPNAPDSGAAWPQWRQQLKHDYLRQKRPSAFVPHSAGSGLRSGVDSWWTAGLSNDLPHVRAATVAKRGAIIAGPTGVGKTTLAVTYLQLAQAEGMSLARTTGTRASRGSPFGALKSVLPPEPGGDDLVREDHPELLRRYGRAVVDGAGGRPLLVGLEGAADK
jgi:hypothetical protein